MSQITDYDGLALKAAQDHVDVQRYIFIRQIIEGLETFLDPEDTVEVVLEALRGSVRDYEEVLNV